MASKMALVLPYYGLLPAYFNFYLRSLAGKNLDVLFFSNLEVEKSPENFKLIKMSFGDIKRLASEKLGVSVCLDSPRRLCDFRPMYGKIFEDYLKGYDYWAFGDCDLVYGDAFNDVLQEALEGGCDVFSLHRCYCSGPFCLLKNDERVNALYLKADNLAEVCSLKGPQGVAFDELHGDWHAQLNAGMMTIEECRARGDSFTAIVRRAPEIKSEFREIIVEDGLLGGETVELFPDGRLTRAGVEIPIFHLVWLKYRRYFTCPPIDYGRFSGALIDNAGFYVTPFQRRFRRALNLVRKAGAAARSLRDNGLKRLSKNWMKG